MKTFFLKIALLFVASIGFLSCSKDDAEVTPIPEPKAEKYRIKQYISPGATFNITYNAQNQPIKYDDPAVGTKSELEYNANGFLIKQEYKNQTPASSNSVTIYTVDSQGRTLVQEETKTVSGDKTKYENTYNANGVESYIYSTYTAATATWNKKSKVNYQYNSSGFNTTLQTYDFNPATQSWVLYTTVTKTYNSQGKETSLTSVIVTGEENSQEKEYNANGNITSFTSYKKASANAPKIKTSESITTYDVIKPIPYQYMYFDFLEYKPLKNIAIQYNQTTGALVNSFTTNYAYEYNEAGYQTKYLVNGVLQSSYLLEKIN